MSFSSEHNIPSKHPSLDGHFPDNPIVPGVVLLEEVIAALHKWIPGSRIKGLTAVKFLRPLKPDNRFTIDLQEKVPGKITFNCRSEQQLLNTGTLILHTEKIHA